MKTEVSSDKSISQAVVSSVIEAVNDGLSRYGNRLTRAEVHLKNLESSGAGRTLECILEVRPANRDPVVSKNNAGALLEAVQGAVEKMERLLDSTFGKLDSPKGGPSASGQPT